MGYSNQRKIIGRVIIAVPLFALLSLWLTQTSVGDAYFYEAESELGSGMSGLGDPFLSTPDATSVPPASEAERKSDLVPGNDNQEQTGNQLLVGVEAASTAIDPDRLPAGGKWDPGIPGGIPNRTTICATIETGTQGDDTSAIQAAIDNCPMNQVVELGSGTFTISSTLRLKSNMVLRGSGIQSTVLQFTADATTNPIIRFGVDQDRYTNEVMISSGHTKGSTSIVVPDADGYQVGDYALISQLDGDGYIQTGSCTWAKKTDRSQGQIVHIQNISGTTIEFTPSLYFDYNASFAPELSKIGTTWTENAGLEDMYIYRENGANMQGSAIDMSQTAYSWMVDVEIYKGYGHIVRLQTAFKNVLRGNYIHHAWGYTSGATAYGIAVREYSTDNLVENNIIFFFNNAIFMENAGAGNVISYNFMDGIWLDQPGSEGWQAPDFGDHCSHNHMDLFEGNMATKTKLDNVHQSTAAYWLHFREHFDADTGWGQEENPPVDDYRNLTAFNADNGRWISVVGCVLGSPGQYSPNNAYECRGQECDSTYGLDYVTYRCRVESLCDETLGTMHRHGNVDFITAQEGLVRWDSDYGRTLPQSFYLSSKPSWWDEQGEGRPWPSIGPDVAMYVIDIPAKDRFEGEIYSVVTPTPTPDPTPTFVDVPLDHWAYDYIEALYQGGFIAGCNSDPLMYCPESAMTRAESAVFVERGVYGAGHLPAQPTEEVFADVPLGEWFAKWSTALWEDGYTAGCGTDPLIYCPLQGHTRTEGCVFFLRMLYGADYVPPDPEGIFSDVPLEGWGAKWIEAAYNAGLIPACETTPDLRFCPEEALDRAMAAYMMVQAKGIAIP